MFRMYDQYSKEINFSELTEPEETWELQDLIGEGTYGEVYSAKHRQTGEVTAVKILESIHEVIEEIEEEFRILRDFNDHPNMPRLYGLYLKKGATGTDDQLWIVMEMCFRGSVTDLAKSLVDRGLKLDEILLAHILKETLKVLMFLHKNHVIHRDVKGHNILLTEKGCIKLIDFGVSGHTDGTLDRKKTSVGTPYWMAPEVIACERQLDYDYDIRCDVWSLGITAIELIDGAPPLADKHPMRALFRIPRNPPPQMKSPDDWSTDCKDFIARCLCKDYEQRPFSWDLIEHPFLQQVPEDTIQLNERLIFLSSQVERIIHEPDVTTKQGRLKSRKSRQGPPPTTNDLTQLEVLDEESIVAQLFTRYTQSIIYTYIGDILLAVNPFHPLTIYSEEYSQMYMNAAKGDHPPHIFAIADQAYQMMVHQKKHQCIVISGESGAGKTVSANFLVQQLTQLGMAPNRDLEEKILQVNPLMEAFGNAKTVINDNSSRFGKYLEMFFTENGTVTGAKITEYLLEKSRVIFQAQGEQNFHIFYYVHDGLPREDKNHKYHLQENASYRYISEHTNGPSEMVSLSANRVKFKAIQHCFSIIGFKEEEVSSIFGVIAAILHVGNIEFMDKQSEGHSGDGVVVSNTEIIDTVAKLLGLESKDLVEVLTTTGMVARGEVIIRENTMHEALDVRDAMSKSLYGRLFSWIVNKINVLLQPDKHMYKEENLNIIGLLDIFGFENFPTNSFEQLCINIANEQIQYYFNQHIFAWELQEYENEGVDGSTITFVDNRPLLDMFLMKPLGLLSLLDEESHFPKATDSSLVEKFHQNVKSPYYSRPKATSSLHFSIDHYAGKVRYDGKGFLEKNRDRLPVEVVNLLRASENNVVRSLFQTPLTKTGNLASGSLKVGKTAGSSMNSPTSTSTGFTLATVQSIRSQQTSSMGGSRGSSAASMTRIQQTVATYFRFSLMDLLAKMVAGSPHFVRCVRPNEDNIPDKFDSKKVVVQLKYTGVLETTRIRREGYSHRVLFAEFVKRYSLLTLGQVGDITPNKTGCKLLLKHLQIENWALGKTKVFLKFYHVELLARKYAEIEARVSRIQAVIRTMIARRQFHELKWKMIKSSVLIQKYARGWLVRKRFGKMFEKRKVAAVNVQKVVRGFLTRKHVLPVLEKKKASAVRIQSVYRGHRDRKHVSMMKDERHQNAVKLQRVFRSMQAKRQAKAELEKRKKTVHSKETAAVKIQSNFRMWKCKQVYQKLLKFREKKDLQLIYFTQQVEAYSEELSAKLLKTNFYAKPVPIPDELSSGPSSQPRAPSKGGRVKRSAPMVTAMVAKQAPASIKKPNVGEARLEHMEKMQEVKKLLPDDELQYYSNLNVKQMTEGSDNNSTTSSHRIRLKTVMDEDTENYYATVAKRPLSDSREDILALGETAASINHKHTNNWDAPLEIAKQKILTPRVLHDNGSPRTPPTILPLTPLAPPTPPVQSRPLSSVTDEVPPSCQSLSPFFYGGDGILSQDQPLSLSPRIVTEDQPDGIDSKFEYFHSFSSLVTNQPGSLVSNQPGPSTRAISKTVLSISNVSPISPVKFSIIDQNSDQESSNSTRNSVTSHDLAINLLDEVLANSASQDLSSAFHGVGHAQNSLNSSSSDITPPLSDGNQSSRRSSKLSTSSDPVMRDRLARTAAAAIIANKPESIWRLKMEPAWDDPLKSMYGKDPIATILGNHHSAPRVDIDEDFKTDREEFFTESKKEDLLKTLHEEYRKSAKGKWHMLQKLLALGHFTSQHSSSNENQASFQTSNQIQGPSVTSSESTNQNHRPSLLTYQGHTAATPPGSKKTVISVKYSGNQGNNRQQNGFHSENGGKNRPGSKVKFSLGEPTVINIQPHKKKTVVMDTNQNYLSSSLSSSSDSANFRSVLKKTDIDLETLKHVDTDSEKPIYDFRKMLRKTGRLDMIAQQQ